MQHAAHECSRDVPRDFDDEEPTFPITPVARPRILLAEDDASLRRLIGHRLRRECFDVIEACCGADAHHILHTIGCDGSPVDDLDLIILDQRMPGPTGLELAAALRAAGWQTPILLLTAYPDSGLISDSTRLGVPVLAKPIDLDQLSDAAIGAIIGPVPA